MLAPKHCGAREHSFLHVIQEPLIYKLITMNCKAISSKVGVGLLWGFIFTAASVASAQTPKYATEEQIFVAAIVSPDSIRQILLRLVGICAPYSPLLRTTGEQEFRAWEVRHQRYLDESRSVLLELEARYASPSVDPRTRQALKDMLEVSAPKIIDAQYQSAIAPIMAAASPVEKMAVCRSYVQSIASREWDLGANDPVLAEFFDTRIKKHNK